MGKLDAAIEWLWLRCTQQPDKDGACKRCGLVWQEEGTTDPHECPPGFQGELEADLRAVLDYVAELEGAHETLLNTALAFCHSIETKLKHGRASQKEVALEKAVAAALTGGEKGGG